MNAITYAGRRGCFKSTNKAQTEAKKLMKHYSTVIDNVIAEALEESFSPNFVEALITKLINDETSFYEPVKCAYLSTSTFQPSKFYKQLQKHLSTQKQTIKFYESPPSLHDLLRDAKKESNDFIGIFNVSNGFDRKFFKKVVDLLLEGSHSAVLLFITMFNLVDESSLGFLGIPSYVSSIYDRKKFIESVEDGLVKIPLHQSTVEKEILNYDKVHRSDRILSRRLKLHLVKFVSSEKDAQICHLLMKLRDDLDASGNNYQKSLETIYDKLDIDEIITTFGIFEDVLHRLGIKESNELKGCLKQIKDVEKENNEDLKEVYNEMVEIVTDIAQKTFDEDLKKGKLSIIEDTRPLSPPSFVDNLYQPGLEDFKMVYEMIFEIAYEHQPICYSEVLDQFKGMKEEDGGVPSYVKKYPVEYYFRYILDSLTYCGLLERRADNPEAIKFLPMPRFDLIQQQISSNIL